MRYFVAGILKGQVAEYHQKLAEEVATMFGLPMRASYLPSHYTFKAPFDATPEQIEELKPFLHTFSQQHRPTQFKIHGFGHLGRALVTLDLLHSKEMEGTVSQLNEVLRGFSWVSWSSHEPIFHFHVTIANDTTWGFDEIWKHLKEKQTPHFDLYFDGFALLSHKDGVWAVDSTYPFSG